MDAHTGGLLRAADLSLPGLCLVLAPLHPIEADHGVIPCGHGHGILGGGIVCETEIIAEVILTNTHSVVHAVTKYAVLAHLGDHFSVRHLMC